MELNTILNILYQNGMENVVALAVQLDANIKINDDITIGDLIPVEIHKDYIKPLGLKFKGDEYHGKYPCQIVAKNEYKLNEKYLVLLPDGSTKWYDPTRQSTNRSNSKYTETVPLEEKKELV